jgi:hypothetical protein
MVHYLETTKSGIDDSLLIRPVVYPSGKPRIPHLPPTSRVRRTGLRYLAAVAQRAKAAQGFGVKYYSLALEAWFILVKCFFIEEL